MRAPGGGSALEKMTMFISERDAAPRPGASVAIASGEDAPSGLSLHHRSGSAEVSKGVGIASSDKGVEASGIRFGVEVRVGVPADATWCEAGLGSPGRAVPKTSGDGRGLGGASDLRAPPCSRGPRPPHAGGGGRVCAGGS